MNRRTLLQQRYKLMHALVGGLLCATTLFTGIAHGQALQAKFLGYEDNVISEGEVVQLQLTLVSAGNTSQVPDVSRLETNFHLGSRQTGYQRQIINGVYSESQTFTLSLLPKRTGQIRIPSFTWNGRVSDPFTINVRPLRQSERNERRDLAYMEYTITPEHAYVNSAVTIHRKFYYKAGVQLASSLPSFPHLENATRVQLLDTTDSLITLGNSVYTLLEDKYAIFPEKSGQLAIPSQQITVSHYPDFSRRRQVLNVLTDEHLLEVRSIPSEFPQDHPWFPASKVEVKSEFVPANLAAVDLGEAVQWNIRMAAEDTYAQTFPLVNLEVPEEIQIFTETPKKENVSCGSTICGIVEWSSSLIPTKPGRWVIPPQSLYWWNTNTDSLEQIVFGRETIHVVGESVPQPVQESQSNEERDSVRDTSVSQIDETPNNLTLATTENEPTVFEMIAPTYWTAVALLLAIGVGVLATLSVRGIRNRFATQNGISSGNGTGTKKSRTHGAPKDQAPVKVPSFKGLKPLQVKEQTLNWIEEQFNVGRVDSLHLFERTPNGKKLLTELNEAIYQEGSTVDISLLSAFLRSMQNELISSGDGRISEPN